MDAATYDAWDYTPRSSWIGEVEYRLLQRMLAPVPGAMLLDVGCGTGAYRGAHWYTVSEIHDLLRGLAVRDVLVLTAVFVPSAGAASRVVERLVPDLLPLGAFIAVVGTPRAASLRA